MDTAFDQLLESPDNLEYLAQQSRLLNVSPRRFLREMGTLSHRGNGAKSQSCQVSKSFEERVAEVTARLRAMQVDVKAFAEHLKDESAYDAAMRLGLIGIVKDAPSDLSTNPKYLEGFGK
ncbi:hypothetical protein Pla108_24650 [Botrimarina colliarenosi]|uniref:Uncharacterized protein n=1 Tax=Botrimarina colliarenosi TaxID=2528001 RepID=A0A5C6AC93_9BACT|nr:hypothetical protein [Botrimarina colliarenosi]TWT96691.1 hypothetical protein Pla108_24650 [Botrimarina colliarenosi]